MLPDLYSCCTWDVLKLPQDVSKVTGTLGAVVGSSLCWICSPLRKISSCLGQYSIVSPCIHTHWSGGCHVWIFRSEVFWVVKYEPQKMVYSGYVCEIWMIFKVTPRRFLGPYTSTVSLAKLSPVGEVPPACISSCPEKEQLGVGPGENTDSSLYTQLKKSQHAPTTFLSHFPRVSSYLGV